MLMAYKICDVIGMVVPDQFCLCFDIHPMMSNAKRHTFVVARYASGRYALHNIQLIAYPVGGVAITHPTHRT